MSRFCDTLKLFKLANLRILLNDLWTLAYDGVEAKTGLAPASCHHSDVVDHRNS
jgi:hypothetical protein